MARVLTVAATAALAMGVPVAASAAPNAQTVLVSGGAVTAAPGKSTPKVTCPAGYQVAGGGASTGSPGGVFLLAGGPTDGGRSWVEQVRNTLSSNSTATVWAVCVQGLSSYREVDNTVTIATNNGGGAAASCANTEHVLGGGSSTNGTDIDPVFIPTTGAWWYGMFNHDASPVSATSQALCGNGFTNYVETTGDVVTIPPGKVGGVFAPCPGGMTAISGGGAPRAGGGGVIGAKITDSYPTGGGWWSAVQNNTQDPATIVTHADCVS